MQDSIEHIIKDLYALDPSLEKDDAIVRALVSELSTAKPVVAVDGVFVRTLREQLVTKTAAPVVAKPIPSPWLMYFIPVAATAVLVLMLIPTKPHTAMPTEAPIMQTEMYMESADDAGGAMKRSAPVVEEASMMMISDSAPAANDMANDSFIVNSQAAGDEVYVEYLTLFNPTFVVVETVEGGQVLGVSELLYPGSVDQVVVPLMIPTASDQIYYVTLYHDDGDGIFSIETDYIVYDPSGAVMQQPFSTTVHELQ